MCSDDKDCPTGSLCISNSCEYLCLEDKHCPSSTTCKSKTNTCTGNIPFGNPLPSSSTGGPTPDGMTISCTVNSTINVCPINTVCTNELCTYSCIEDKNCPFGSVCENSLCEFLCIQDKHCLAGSRCKIMTHTCTNGVPVIIPGGSAGPVNDTSTSSTSSGGISSTSGGAKNNSDGKKNNPIKNPPPSTPPPTQSEVLPVISSEPIPVQDIVNGDMVSGFDSSQLIAGSENALFLRNLSDDIKDILANSTGKSISIQITDRDGQVHTIMASIFFPPDSSSPLLITDIVPENLDDASLSNLIILIDNAPVAQTIVSVVKPRVEDGTADESLSPFIPVIEEAIVVRKKKSLRVKLTGENFLRNLKIKKKKVKQTIFEVIPTDNLIFKKKLIRLKGTFAKAYFHILDKSIQGEFVAIITNPFGRAVRKIEVPPKKIKPKKSSQPL